MRITYTQRLIINCSFCIMLRLSTPNANAGDNSMQMRRIWMAVLTIAQFLLNSRVVFSCISFERKFMKEKPLNVIVISAK